MLARLRKHFNVTGKYKETMKPLLTLFCLFIFGQICFAQFADNTDRHNGKNIYLQALKQYLDFRATDSFYSKLKHIDTIYVYKDTKTTDSLLDRIGTTRIIMIQDPYTYIKNRNGKDIILYSIYPLEFEKGEFWVSFVPFIVRIDKKQKQGVIFSNPGSYKVVFMYNNGQFVFLRLEVNTI